ncbi:MAG: hypothetical protein HY662_04785 [Chloroflexi bacterium]|nr:hypothetical protein [Chloroflexota bacterium]
MNLAGNKGDENKIGKSKMAFGQKRLLLVGFRLVTLVLALIELEFDPQQSSLLPGIVIATGAILYTGFKIIHPLRWYTSSPFRGTVLIIVDVMVCTVLLLSPRVIHPAFALYSLNPVLTSALLFPPRHTRVAAGVTAFFYAVNFFSSPLTTSLEYLNGILFTYIVALGLTAWLPYVVNANTQQSLKSRILFQERLKLGREIHDGLCQTIYGLSLELQALRRDIGQTGRAEERVKHLEEIVGEAEREARGSIGLLRSFNGDQPFLTQIEDSLEHIKNETGIVYRLEATSGEPHLDDLVKLETLYICEEALRNVAKHSGARQVTVRVRSPNGQLQVDIADDGCGMMDDRLVEGYGLMVMKERAESLGGSLEVVSNLGVGTKVRVEVPRKWSPELQVIR